MGFSRITARESAIAMKVRRAITMAKNPISSDGTVNDFSISHPSEVREASDKKYSNLTKRVTEETKKWQVRALERRRKLA